MTLPLSDSLHRQVVRAALAWWRERCPASWDEGKHLDIPAVNCSSDAENELADAVAALVSATPPQGPSPAGELT